MWKYVRTLLPNDETAADAVQNVWVRILRGLPSLRDPALFGAWAYRIAHHAAMDQLRRKYADALIGSLDENDEETAGAAVESDPSGEEDLEALEAGLMSLPVVERNVLSLFYLQELSLAEIAGVSDVPLGTVKSRLHRARRLLRRLMESPTPETKHA